MRRCWLSLFAIAGLVAGCSESEPEPVTEPAPQPIETEPVELPDEVAMDDLAAWIYTDQDEYSLPVSEITVTIENVGEKLVNTGEALRLEKWQDETWMSQLGAMEFTQELINVASGETFIDSVPLDFMEEPLTPGTYRVVKEVQSENRDSEQVVEKEIAAVFEVTE